MKYFNLISFRLFLLIIVILSVLTFTESYFQLQTETENYEHMITACGERASSMILGSTRLSMLMNRKEDAYSIMQTLAENDEIMKIRIFSKKGLILYSTENSERGKTVTVENESCYACHKTEGEVISAPETEERKRIFHEPDGSRLLGFVTAVRNEESCYNADCHYHSKDEELLGVIDVVLSLKATDEIIATSQESMVSNNIIITLILALTVGAFIWFVVHIPVQKLLAGTKAISSGYLGYKIDSSSNDEMGMLAKSFNRMTTDLVDAKKEITNWSNELEKRVAEKTRELERAQDNMLHIEKMASLGKLSATVAHELNNPLSGILTYSKLIQRKLGKVNLHTEEHETIIKNLKMIETESSRCGAIIKDLLHFSKKDVKQFKPVKLNSIIETSIHLINHHLELHNITLQKNLADNIPEIKADDNLLKQALLALYFNAVEAMEKDGVLSVSTSYNTAKNKVFLTVRDNGKGIPEEISKDIFEPFFTTKNAVKGVGLGLAVVYGIVQNHNGEIKVDSEINKGTTFTIILPVS